MQSILTKILDLQSSTERLIASEPGKWFTGVDLQGTAEGLRQSLQESGAASGGVAICCSTGPAFVAALIAVIQSGRSPVLLGSKWPMHEIAAALSNSPCAALITDQTRFRDEFIHPDWDCLNLEGICTGGYLVWRNLNFTADVPEGEWLGQFTSGTTGKSRLVIRSWAAIEDEILALEEASGLPPGGIYLNMAPLHHSYGFCGGLIWPLLRGSALYNVHDFYPSACRRIWAELHPVVVYGLPFQYDFIAISPGTEVNTPRIAFSAGGPLTYEVRSKAKELLGVQLSNNYGSTETGTMCVYRDMPLEVSDHCVGWPLPNRHFQVSEDGVLLLFSQGTMERYYDGPEAAIPYTLGDLGHIRSDGCIEVLGRLRPVINVGGAKISPEKVEDVIKACPGISDAVVMGTAVSGFHQMVSAFVEIRAGVDLTEEEIRTFCKARLLPVEVPKRVHLMDKIPKSETGKIQGKYLLEMS
ncbi:hypothetical protein GCM10010913_26140 [Paenibacillus aceti]|uniref:Acyl-CoA synthetase n=1 Tax=Paenibacillus aceti TaxID=1820010 RepID=A0ABQ1VWU2_9BACL|nr:class I adenylate-forming enzyme family protein [Paenibacillus aceti]GGG03159.1 hypothetical protein GCM10010913_26140 [Paenibacillus aceti]